MIPHRGIPGIEAYPLRALPSLLVERTPAPPLTGAAEERWEAMVRANPRHFDGPLLAVVSFDAERNEVLARRDGYARLAVQPQVATGVQQLSVTAVLIARDGGGREYVLLGKRSRETRIFGDMWEVGPSGGLPPPPLNVDVLEPEAVMSHLADEIEEEVGGVEVSGGRAVAYVRDQVAHSDDICIAYDLGPLEKLAGLRPGNWEYTEVRWLPVDALAGVDTLEADRIIGATRGLFRALGWVPESV